MNDIMLSDIIQAQEENYCMNSIKNVELIETKERQGVGAGVGRGMESRNVGLRRLSLRQDDCSRNLYNMVTVVTTNVNLKIAKKVDLKYFNHKRKI